MNSEETEEIYAKHLGAGGILELKREDGTVDKFQLKPLNVEHIPKLFFIMSKMGSGKDDFLEKLDETLSQKILDLIDITLLKSYPDWSEKIRKEFAAANFMPLMNKIFQINNLGAEQITDRNAMAKIKHLQKIAEQKDANSSTTNK